MTNDDIKKENLDENKDKENENVEDVVKEDEVQDESQEVIVNHLMMKSIKL